MPSNSGSTLPTSGFIFLISGFSFLCSRYMFPRALSMFIISGSMSLLPCPDLVSPFNICFPYHGLYLQSRVHIAHFQYINVSPQTKHYCLFQHSRSMFSIWCSNPQLTLHPMLCPGYIKHDTYLDRSKLKYFRRLCSQLLHCKGETEYGSFIINKSLDFVMQVG